MSSFNKIILLGNMTRDPELRYTPSGTPVCSFGLAVNHKSGEKEEVCFVDCTCFGRTAEVASEYLRKGRPVLVEGRLTYRQWEGQDGQRRSKHEVVAERVQFLGTGPGGGAPAGAGKSTSQGAPDGEDEDIPF